MAEQPSWKNTSEYSQGETDRTPHTWSLQLPHFRVTLMRRHRHFPGKWVVWVPHLIPDGVLGDDTLSIPAAQKKAEEIVRGALQSVLDALP